MVYLIKEIKKSPYLVTNQLVSKNVMADIISLSWPYPSHFKSDYDVVKSKVGLLNSQIGVSANIKTTSNVKTTSNEITAPRKRLLTISLSHFHHFNECLLALMSAAGPCSRLLMAAYECS